MRTIHLPAVVFVIGLFHGCSGTDPTVTQPPPVSASNHTWFPLGAGTTHEFGKMTPDGPITCDSCHRPTADSFSKVRCDTCHKHPEAITPRLHLGLPASFVVDTSSTDDPDEKAELRGASCYGCHPTGEKRAFSHTSITSGCAECHAPDTAFAALPKPGFTHQEIGATDCGACHVVTAWSPATSVPSNVADPLRNVSVDALQPSWSGTTITSVTADPQALTMTMNHGTTALDAGVLQNCSLCHATADVGLYYPGVLHWSLTNAGIAQPAHCDECHGNAGPRSFVGELDATRAPSTGPMRHDAVVWASGAATTTPVVTTGCVTCHQPPDSTFDATWKFAYGRDDGGAEFHRSLTDVSLAQPTSCLDCHANSRPAGTVTSAGIAFDHSTALGECADCHASTSTWTGGRFHTAAAPPPSTCLPCHAAERPTSTSGWMGSFAASPFDYGTNSLGLGHGAGQDCVVCHAGPGTGATWGNGQNWRGGHFEHAGSSVAASSCITCHTTQRPDRLTPPVDPGFDHALNGTGDCLGCHQRTVTRGSYVSLTPIPGGDWREGQSYPGGTLISTPGTSVTLSTTKLTRSGQKVTAMNTTQVTLPNAFLHTATAIPAQVFPGSASNPDQNSCWHCHTATGTSVTSYANGVFHASLANYRATPTGSIAPLPQPTQCTECHAGMRPPDIVAKADGGTWLRPMDHAAALTGGAASSVTALDCSTCHHTPGTGPVQWSDGTFHQNLSGASPTECVNCHYPLMTLTAADVTSPASGLPATFAMKHRSTSVGTHACASCHQSALSKATQTPSTALWNPGAFHATASPQPTACNECHASSKPTQATQSTVTYALMKGGTSSNGAMWMNHADATVTGKDCTTCHQADAKTSGSAWNHSTAFHAKVSGVTTCKTCHGTSNGRGTTVGTNNNLPAGLIDSSTFTTSSAAPANTHDQLTHSQSNVTRFDCNFCHTQVGPSTTAGVQGREWAQASFHRKFTVANPLIIDGTSSRCSTCHLNLKPGAVITAFDHSPLNDTTSQDCSSCHSWPGDNPSVPNWKGAAGKPHADTGSTAASTLDCGSCHGQGGSAMKHLTVASSAHFGGVTNGNSCISCHVNFTDFAGTVSNLKYAHTNATANAGNGCANCHVFSGSLYTTLTTTPSLTHPVSSGSHQFSQTQSVSGSFDGRSFTSNHGNANLARCGSCHQYATTTSTTNIWTFKHRPNNPGITGASSKSAAHNVVGCNMCH